MKEEREVADDGIDFFNAEVLDPAETLDPLEEEAYYEHLADVAPEDTTCFRCSDKESCKYAFDPYNTDGDCLADK